MGPVLLSCFLLLPSWLLVLGPCLLFLVSLFHYLRSNYHPMQYDPIKRSLGNVFNKTPFLRKIFYRLLDLLLLRAWHVHKELRKWINENKNANDILDAGAGFGQYTYWLNRKNKNWKITSVDVKDEQVADCNNFFKSISATNVRFEVGDLTRRVATEYDLLVRA